MVKQIFEKVNPVWLDALAGEVAGGSVLGNLRRDYENIASALCVTSVFVLGG